MFSLFYSIYLALFTGFWESFTIDEACYNISRSVDGLGMFLTNIFGDGYYDRLGDSLFYDGYNPFFSIVAFILALITSIGIVVAVIKAIKHIFTIFFEGLR